MAHIWEIYKEVDRESITKVIIMASYFIGSVDEAGNGRLMEEISKKELQVDIHSF
jgi:hypothetical protein